MQGFVIDDLEPYNTYCGDAGWHFECGKCGYPHQVRGFEDEWLERLVQRNVDNKAHEGNAHRAFRKGQPKFPSDWKHDDEPSW